MKSINSNLVLYISIILVTGSLIQISSTILFENNNRILNIQSSYAGDGGGDGGGGIGVRGTTEESVVSSETTAATNATKGTQQAAALPTQQEGTEKNGNILDQIWKTIKGL